MRAFILSPIAVGLGALVFCSTASQALLAQSQCATAPILEDLGLPGSWSAGQLELRAVGLPDVGASLALRVRGGPPGAPGFAVLSAGLLPLALPQFGAVVFPAEPYLLQTLVLGATGESAPLFAIPQLPTLLCGTQWYSQAVVVEPSGIGGLAFTQGLRIGVGAVQPSLFPGLQWKTPGLWAGPRIVDLDGDGVVDLLLTRTVIAPGTGSQGFVEVLRGRLDGSFDPALTFPVGPAAGNFDLGDLDGDGRLDLVVSNLAAGTVTVLLATGPFQWTPLQTVNAGVTVNGLALADLDQNGFLDLLLPDIGGLSVFPGLGNGSFGTASIQPPGGFDLRVADLNHDGDADVLVAVPGGVGLRVALGGPGGQLNPVQTISPVPGPFTSLLLAFELGDVDGDGELDVVLAESTQVRALRGNGNGTFGTQVLVQPGQTNRIAVADMNADGLDDVLIGIGTPTVALARAGFGFDPPTTIGFPGALEALAAGDVDRDQRPDVLLVGQQTQRLTRLRGLGTGQVATAIPLASPASQYFVEAGDLNGDGRQDLVSGRSLIGQGVYAYLGDGAGGFASPVLVNSSSTSSVIELADLDQDAALDLLVLDKVGAAVQLSVQRGQGDGSFGPKTVYPLSPGAARLLVADLDGDGRDELVVSNGLEASIDIFDQSAGLLVHAGNFPIGGPAGPVAALDLDGDGDLDLAVGRASSPQLVLLTNLGGLQFSAGASLSLPAAAAGLASGDFNGDSRPDLAVGMANAVQLLLGTSSGNLVPQSPVSTAATLVSSLSAGDIDGDGTLDLLLTDSTERTVTVVLRPAGSGGAPQLLAFQTLANALDFDSADFNGDGRLDLVVGGDFSSPLSLLLQGQ